MALLNDPGCGTPTNAAAKQQYLRLAQLFCPVVRFEPEERFFPVDLAGTISGSQLLKTDPRSDPPSAQLLKDFGLIDPGNDLAAASKFHFTTVAGADMVDVSLAGQPPWLMPAPRLDSVYAKYQTGAIPAELTLYATICRARDVWNSSLLATCRDKDVEHGMAEGLILNYFFYFPACESPQWDAEGDWSGVSLLLREAPPGNVDLGNPQQVERFLPVIACYYRKALSGTPPLPYFVAGPHGFRRWADVTRQPEPSLGLDIHPVVYVSRGRHNCYFEPVHTNVPLTVGWDFSAEVIEEAQYLGGGPAVNTLQGGGIEDFPGWGYAIFPPFALLVACATGCDYPVHFDSSGIPAGWEEGEEAAADGGYQGAAGPGGSTYPATPAKGAPPGAPLTVALRLRYVDLQDGATAALWGYPGAWGAATRHKSPNTQRGYFRGARRPKLSAWFVWNLFLDDVFGAAGIPQIARIPF